MWFQELKATDFLLFAIGIWIALLSYYLLKTVSHYKKLTKGSQNLGLDKILERIVDKQDIEAKNISELTSIFVNAQTQAQAHFQKVSLVRFNPFEDAGGDQSFALALLDAKNNGIVISSLHSRSGTRVYAKAVAGAKPQVHQFTKEEKEAVEKAIQNVQKQVSSNKK